MANNKNTYSHEDMKSIVRDILLSDVKPIEGEPREEFVLRRKKRFEPLLKKITNAEINEFDGSSESSNAIKSFFTDEVVEKLNMEKGISLIISENSENYKEIEKAFLEVLMELGAVKI